jgi:hypothetical protein
MYYKNPNPNIVRSSMHAHVFLFLPAITFLVHAFLSQNILSFYFGLLPIVDKETMIEPMELEKSSYVNNTIMDKGINIDLVNLTTQKDSNQTNVKRYSNVKVQTIQGYEEVSIPKVNQ